MVLFFGIQNVKAQQFKLDSTFGFNGIARIANADTNAFTAAWDNKHYSFSTNDKIVSIHNVHNIDSVGQPIQPGIIQFKANGNSVDSSFGLNGAQNTFLKPFNQNQFNSNFASTLCVLKDGRILFGGQKKTAISPFTYISFVVCYLPNGTIDTTFSNKGMFYYYPFPGTYSDSRTVSIYEQSDDRILLHNQVNSYEKSRIIAINKFGEIDSTYGINGVCHFESFDIFNKLELYMTPDFSKTGESIIMGAIYDSLTWTFEHTIFIKIKSNGIPDSNFGINGKLILDTSIQANLSWQFSNITNLQITNSNQLLAILHASYGDYKSIIRLNSNGQVDSSFGVNGIFNINFATLPLPYNFISINSYKELSNGQIALIGYIKDSLNTASENFLVLLLNPNGTLDASFGNNGFSINDGGINSVDIGQIVIQKDSSSFIVCGTSSLNHYLMIKYALSNSFPASTNTFDENNISIYPNPASDKLLIQSKNTIQLISMYDMSGRIIYSKKVHDLSVSINTENIIEGNYILKIVNNIGNTISKKIRIQ